MGNKELLQALKENEDLSIKQVANKLGLSHLKLRDAQLFITKNYVKRDDYRWELINYGR